MNMCIAGIASRFRIKSGAVTAATAAAEVINTSAKLSLSSLNTFSLLAAEREREREREESRSCFFRSFDGSGELRRGVIALRESKRPKHNLGRLSPQREGERVRA